MPRKDQGPIRITTAGHGHSVDIATRQRRYIISMLVRTLCFVLAFFSVGHWYMWVLIAGAVFLPYFAVVLANVGASTDPEPLESPSIGAAALPPTRS